MAMASLEGFLRGRPDCRPEPNGGFHPRRCGNGVLSHESALFDGNLTWGSAIMSARFHGGPRDLGSTRSDSITDPDHLFFPLGPTARLRPADMGSSTP
jgi:hypothetical protein